jgi:hypothetical protein
MRAFTMQIGRNRQETLLVPERLPVLYHLLTAPSAFKHEQAKPVTMSALPYLKWVDELTESAIACLLVLEAAIRHHGQTNVSGATEDATMCGQSSNSQSRLDTRGKDAIGAMGIRRSAWQILRSTPNRAHEF